MTATASASALAESLRQPGTVLLDGPLADADTGRAGAWLFAEPRQTLRADSIDGVVPLLRALDEALKQGHFVAGWLAYEAGYALEADRFVDAAHESPLGWFGTYDAPIPVEAADLGTALGEAGVGAVSEIAAAITEAEYAERIARVRHHIREGDVYQINLTWPLRFETEDPLALYSALRRRQPTAYGALVRTGDLDVLSLSPELFFRIQDGAITARPMKGTAPRGETSKEDRQRAEALVADPKNRAENLMIVDLLRNDLGRVARPGSVRVPRLFQAEQYPTVTQMTSTVQAELRPEAGFEDVMRALFPCGSITGAPKLRAMEIIREIESGPRGVYCGAIGYAAPGQGGGLARAAFNVPIRTAVLRGTEGRYDVGSGVVWDSEWRSEWMECWLKAEVLTGLAR
ncbi:MAG: aminodeoxychorismate synthase component I [Bacteroidota bacterium]